MNEFFIRNHAGEGKYYTEESFHAQIMDDAIRSRYDWHVPITEIARVVPTFQKEYRDDIYRAVLDCFFHIQAERKLSSDNQEAVWECFLDLKDDSEENRDAKAKYASRHVENAITAGPAIFHMHYGAAWHDFLEEFRKTKGQEWRLCDSPESLQNWSDSLASNLAGRLETAEEAGIFEKDDAEGMADMIKMIKAINDIDENCDVNAFMWDLRLP
jgi:hypothetical protein